MSSPNLPPFQQSAPLPIQNFEVTLSILEEPQDTRPGIAWSPAASLNAQLIQLSDSDTTLRFYAFAMQNVPSVTATIASSFNMKAFMF